MDGQTVNVAANRHLNHLISFVGDMDNVVNPVRSLDHFFDFDQALEGLFDCCHTAALAVVALSARASLG